MTASGSSSGARRCLRIPRASRTTPAPRLPSIRSESPGIIACHCRAAEWWQKDVELAAHDRYGLVP